jgi:hypothetical protein
LLVQLWNTSNSHNTSPLDQNVCLVGWEQWSELPPAGRAIVALQ